VEGRELYAAAMREGHVHAWAGRWREAVSSYRRALEFMAQDVTARSSLATALAHAGLASEALATFEELAVDRPDDTAVALRVAELRQRIGRMDDADDAYLRVAALYHSAGQGEKAKAIWRRLIELSGHRTRTMARLADEAAAAGDAEVADEARRLVAIATEAAAQRARDEQTRQALETAAAEESVAKDELLARLALDPYSLECARALGLALRARSAPAADRQLDGAADAAELVGELGLAIELLRDRLPLVADPVPLYRRMIRLALLGEAVETAADAQIELAEWFLARGEPQAALAEARRARAVAPLIARVQAEAAEVMRAVGLAGEADDAVRRAFQLAPRQPVYAAAYAATAARRGSFDEVGVALEALVEGPANADELRTALAWLGANGQPLVAWCRGRLLELIGEPAERDLAIAAQAPPPLGPTAAVYLAEKRLVGGDAAGALSALRPWLNADVAAVDGGPERSRLAGLALSAADLAGDEQAALASLRTLVAVDPHDATTAALLAERLAALGDVEGAVAELVRLADQRRGAGDVDAAAALIDGALALRPGDGRLLAQSAELALARGDRDVARDCYVRAARSGSPARLEWLLSAAELAPWGQRVELLNEAITGHPTEPEPRRRLVSALVSSGQASQAAAAAAELAELLEASGDRVGAIAAIEQARRLDPWNAGLAALSEALRADADAG
jgi:tetratricopeptide (TPR) repeat protein